MEDIAIVFRHINSWDAAYHFNFDKDNWLTVYPPIIQEKIIKWRYAEPFESEEE